MDNLKNNFKQLTPQELLDIFPGAIPSIKRNLRIWKKIQKNGEQIHEAMLDIALNNLFTNYPEAGFKQDTLIKFAEEWFYKEPMEKIEKHIRELNHLLQLHNNKNNPTPTGQITNVDIQKAKQYPIEDLSPNKLNHSDFINCPFHKEKTNSCKINIKKNTWHCFGCNKGGDSVDFVMELEGLDFISAVKRLL